MSSCPVSITSLLLLLLLLLPPPPLLSSFPPPLFLPLSFFLLLTLSPSLFLLLSSIRELKGRFYLHISQQKTALLAELQKYSTYKIGEHQTLQAVKLKLKKKQFKQNLSQTQNYLKREDSWVMDLIQKKVQRQQSYGFLSRILKYKADIFEKKDWLSVFYWLTSSGMKVLHIVTATPVFK